MKLTQKTRLTYLCEACDTTVVLDVAVIARARLERASYVTTFRGSVSPQRHACPDSDQLGLFTQE